MELSQMRYFKCVAETEHFTKAAEILHISQPSLSKSISNLEDELGIRLFERNKRYVRLTDYGKTLLQRVNRILQETDEAKQEIQEMAGAVRGDIRIATCTTFASPSKIYQFSRAMFLAHPEISIHQYILDNQQIEEMLLNRRIDFAYAFDLPDHAEIQATMLWTFRLGIVVSTLHPLADRKEIHLADLKDDRFLTNNTSPDEKDTAYMLCHKAGFHPNIIFEGDASGLIGEAVAKNVGVAFISEDRHRWKQQQEYSDPWDDQICFLSLADDFCTRIVYLYVLRNRYLPAASRLFLNGLLKNVNLPEKEPILLP